MAPGNTITSFHTTMLHHGMVIVGVPYSQSGLMHMGDVSGGTPYGATTLAGPDGSRQPSENELKALVTRASMWRRLPAGCHARFVSRESFVDEDFQLRSFWARTTRPEG
jgi:hypothetical protein